MTAMLSILGYAGTKKSIVANILTQADPPVGADSIWELAGQPRFDLFWKNVLANSLVAIIISDGTLGNVLRSKRLVSYVREVSSYVVVAVVAIKDKQDSLTEKRMSEILGMPVHLLDFNDTSFGTQIIEIVKQLIKEGLRIQRPKPGPIKEPPTDKGVLLALLRIALKRKLSNDETIEEIVGAVEQGSQPALAKAREIMMGADGLNIPKQYIDWLLSDCQMQFHGEDSR
jgi:hypothetical protein